MSNEPGRACIWYNQCSWCQSGSRRSSDGHSKCPSSMSLVGKWHSPPQCARLQPLRVGESTEPMRQLLVAVLHWVVNARHLPQHSSPTVQHRAPRASCRARRTNGERWSRPGRRVYRAEDTCARRPTKCSVARAANPTIDIMHGQPGAEYSRLLLASTSLARSS